MKLEAPKNPNYAANIVRVRNLVDLEGLDNLKAAPLLGYQALVSKDTPLEELMVLFTAESQLSLEYAAKNNLHRHADLNEDESQTGYLEDNRRVKAIKLRGHNSNALLMPLTSLLPFAKQSDLDTLQEGDIFDTLNGHEIVKKYMLKEPGTNRKVDKNAVAKYRVDEALFPLHFDTENYWRNASAIPADAPIVVTQKLHGTSIRFGKVPVAKELTIRDKIGKWFGVAVRDTEFSFVVGSRKVIKSVDGGSNRMGGGTA